MWTRTKKFKYGYMKGVIGEKFGEEHEEVFQSISRGDSVNSEQVVEDLVDSNFINREDGDLSVNYKKLD